MNGYLNKYTLMNSTEYCYVIKSYAHFENDNWRLKNSLEGPNNWHFYGCSVNNTTSLKHFNKNRSKRSIWQYVKDKIHFGFYKDLIQ